MTKKYEWNEEKRISSLSSLDEILRLYSGPERKTKDLNRLYSISLESMLSSKLAPESSEMKKTGLYDIIKENLINYNSDLIIKDPFKKNKYTSNLNYKELEKIFGTYIKPVKISSYGFTLPVKESVSISADNLAEFALPIVQYIHETRPDYIVASDRGARLLGLAVFKMYRQLYRRLPTADGTLRFRRFSKRNTQQQTEEHLRPLVEEMLRYKRRPTVLVLDDWVCSGSTKRLACEVFDDLSKGKVKVKFGVLVGEGGDVSGNTSHTFGFADVTDWRDDSNIIGVRYGHDNYGLDGGIKPEPVRSLQAREYRIRMHEGVTKLIRKLVKESGKEKKVPASCAA